MKSSGLKESEALMKAISNDCLNQHIGMIRSTAGKGNVLFLDGNIAVTVQHCIYDEKTNTWMQNVRLIWNDNKGNLKEIPALVNPEFDKDKLVFLYLDEKIELAPICLFEKNIKFQEQLTMIGYSKSYKEKVGLDIISIWY